MPLKLIILDRDGVINEDSDDFIKSVDEFKPIPGSIEAIAKLKQAGFLIAIASNQSGIARGLFTLKTLNAMHSKLATLLKEKHTAIDYIAICPHGPNDLCDCRKPKPGLLIEICKALHTKAEEAMFIGDSFRDFEAAEAAQMPFALVETGKGKRTLEKHPELLTKAPAYKSLADFAKSL